MKSFYKIYKIYYSNQAIKIYDNLRDLYDFLIEEKGYTLGFSYLERVIYKDNIKGWFIGVIDHIEKIEPSEDLFKEQYTQVYNRLADKHPAYVARLMNKWIKNITRQYMNDFNSESMDDLQEQQQRIQEEEMRKNEYVEWLKFRKQEAQEARAYREMLRIHSEQGVEKAREYATQMLSTC